MKLNIAPVRMVGLSDASFGNEVGMKSQFGFVILLTDGEKRANIVHYRSARRYRASRQVIAAEVYVLVHAFSNCYVICEVLHAFLGQHFEHEAFLDCRTLFNIFKKNSNTVEHQLQSDVVR